MKSIRRLAATRRVLAALVAASGLVIGLAVGASAAHASTGCIWAPVTLMNNWHSEEGMYDTGDPSVCLESDGMVYLSGSVAALSGSSSSEFGTLPAWAWPAHNLWFDVYTFGRTYGVLRIYTDGTMYAYGGLGQATAYTSLAGISYPSTAVPQTDLSLVNNWQSAQSQWNSGDPAWSETNGIIHLSGSLGGGSFTTTAATLPTDARPPDSCFSTITYTYYGGIGYLSIDQLDEILYADNAQYTSLAGINYPSYPTYWSALSLLNGQAGDCNPGPSYLLSSNVVYLTGGLSVPSGFNGEIAVLPPEARPTHYLYMIASNANGGTATVDKYVALKIDPSGAMWILSPPNGSASDVSLSGLSFHLS